MEHVNKEYSYNIQKIYQKYQYKTYEYRDNKGYWYKKIWVYKKQ